MGMGLQAANWLLDRIVTEPPAWRFYFAPNAAREPRDGYCREKRGRESRATSSMLRITIGKDRAEGTVKEVHAASLQCSKQRTKQKGDKDDERSFEDVFTEDCQAFLVELVGPSTQKLAPACHGAWQTGA